MAPSPELRGDQTEGPETALLDEVDEHVSLADAEPGAGDALATEGSLALDAGDFQARPLHGTGLRPCGCSVHLRIVPRSVESASLGYLLLHGVADRAPAAPTRNEVDLPPDPGDGFGIAHLIFDVELGDIAIGLAP